METSLSQRFAPVVMANRQLLPVASPLKPLFASGGLQQGWSIGVSGPGGWSLALALVGGALAGDRGAGDQGVGGSRGAGGQGGGDQGGGDQGGGGQGVADGWVACVGLEELGLLAADEIGVGLDRVLMVESPGREHLATVIASLIEAVDVICLGLTPSLGARDARRLMARAREQNAVLFHLDGGRTWPQPLDVVLTVESGPWSGMGQGYGRLQTRTLSITSTGRRSMAKPRLVEVLLPGPDGGVENAPAHEGAGADSPEGAGVNSRSAGRAGEGVGEWPAFV